jgi:hypothetical protein
MPSLNKRTLRQKINALLLMLCAVVLPMDVYAAYECNVKVINVLVYADGAVNVLHSGRGDYTVICNVSRDYGNVSPSACAMWTGMLLAIKKKNGSANFYFEGSSTCDRLPTYGNAPIPVYIGDVTP